MTTAEPTNQGVEFPGMALQVGGNPSPDLHRRLAPARPICFEGTPRNAGRIGQVIETDTGIVQNLAHLSHGQRAPSCPPCCLSRIGHPVSFPSRVRCKCNRISAGQRGPTPGFGLISVRSVVQLYPGPYRM
jgi:hypothetical protein